MTKKPLHLHNLKKKKKKTGTPKTFDKLWTDLRNITADMFLAGANAANCNLKHSGWRCGEYAYSPGDWELFGIDFMFDADFKPWVLEVRSFLLLIFSSSFLRFWFIFGRRGLAGLHGERRRRKCGRRARPRSGARRRKEALFALSLFLERRRSPFDRRRSKARSKKKEREGNSRSGRWDRSSRSLSLSFSLARSMRKEKEETNALSSRSARRGTRSSFLRSLFFRGGRRRSKTREKKTHSLTLFFFSLSLPPLPPPPSPRPRHTPNTKQTLTGQRLPGHQAPRLLELGLLRLPSRVRLRHARPRVRRAERRRRRRVRAAAAGDDRAVGLEAARMHGEDLQPLHRGGVLPGVERVQDGGGDGPQGRIRAAVWRRPEPEGGDGRQGDEGLIFLFFLFFFFFFFPFLFCSGLGERYGGRERERGGGEIWRIMTTRKEKT